MRDYLFITEAFLLHWFRVNVLLVRYEGMGHDCDVEAYRRNCVPGGFRPFEDSIVYEIYDHLR